MAKKRVLLDCDGPISDFDESAMRYLTGRVPEGWTPPPGLWAWQEALPPDLRREFEEHCAAPGFAAGMKPTEGAVAALKRLRHKAEVFALTAPWPGSLYWPGERILWLQDLGFQADAIVLTPAKHIVRGDIFVDDRFDWLIRWKEHHPEGTVVLWKTQRNVQHWDDPRVVAVDGWHDERFWAEVEK